MSAEGLLCPESLAPGSECNVMVLVDANDPQSAPEAMVAHLEEDHGFNTWAAILALQEAGEMPRPRQTFQVTVGGETRDVEFVFDGQRWVNAAPVIFTGPAEVKINKEPF